MLINHYEQIFNMRTEKAQTKLNIREYLLGASQLTIYGVEAVNCGIVHRVSYMTVHARKCLSCHG